MQHWTIYLYRRKWVGALAVLLGVCTLGLLYFRMPAVPVLADESNDLETVFKWPERATIEPRYFEAFKWQLAEAQQPVTPAISYLRLAGTFMTYRQTGEEGSQPNFRIAIIDNLQSGKQRMVQQEEIVEGFRVAGVYETYVELAKGDEVFELHVNLAPRTVAGRAATSAEDSGDPQGFEGMPALETNRFGKRIAENRWVFSRKALMDYYEEVINDPERVVGMYKSFTTDRHAESGDPRGFRLGIQAEDAFFSEVGLRQSDVIRKVNSMNMLSQRRAEFMLREFVQHNLNAVVIDVEREGKAEKLIYLIR